MSEYSGIRNLGDKLKAQHSKSENERRRLLMVHCCGSDKNSVGRYVLEILALCCVLYGYAFL